MTPLKEKIILFLPAYFAERTLASVYRKIPKESIDDILLVDDASEDAIELVAHSLGIRFFRNQENLGYGGNIKVCIQKSLESGADILLELHPDDQYDPAAIPAALEKMREGYDFVMGSRFLEPGSALKNKMPLWKYGINRLSTLLTNTVLGLKLTEFHCGFRVYRRRFLETVNFQRNDNDYLFSFQIIAQACAAGFKIVEVPVTCRYFPGATQIKFKKTVLYGLGVLKTLLLFILARVGKKHPLFFVNSPLSYQTTS